MDEIERLTREVMPFAEQLGVQYVSARKDKVVARLLVRPELCTKPDVLHGGAIMAFADTLGAAGTILNLAEGDWTTTIESNTNFVAPAPVNTTVTGEATPIHRGRRTMIWQTRVTNESGKLAAIVTQTQLVLTR